MKFATAVWPFLCTVLAGATMVIGGFLAVSGKKPTENTLSIGMGFSAGMLIYLSFAELVPESVSYFEAASVGGKSIWAAIGILIAGVLFAAIVDHSLPGHDIHREHKNQQTICEASAIYKTGLCVVSAIGLHNATEGIAVFLTVYSNPSLGLPLILGIAMHNIPCGIAIAIPIFAATDDRKKAILMSLKCGLFTFFGAVIAALVLGLVLNNFALGAIMAMAAGIIVYTVAFELYPASKKYERGRNASIISAICGIGLMAFLIAIFG